MRGRRRRKPLWDSPLLLRAGGFLRPVYDGPPSWLWFAGLGRAAAILLIAAGAHTLVRDDLAYNILIGIYLAAAVCGVSYLYSLRATSHVTPGLTWTQMLLDFSVVAATVSFTGGQESVFVFLLLVVVLEAGMLLGLAQGFLFSVGAAAFLLWMSLDSTLSQKSAVEHWYNLSLQWVALFCAAFISGYWNLRISRMKQFQREILDNMNGGFLLVGRNGAVGGANRAACGILGIDEARLRGRPVDTALVTEDGSECPVVTALREGRDFLSYECAVRTPKGGVRLLGLSTNHLYDARGRLETLIVSFTDLTEMDRIRKEMMRQARMAYIGEMAAELAHEIRNPVTSIRGAMEELGRGNLPPQTAERLTAITLRESDHLEKVVAGLLDFARNPELRRAAVSPAALAAEMRDLFEKRHPGLRVEVRAESGEQDIHADPTQMRQLFINLCQNAADAMKGEGRLDIVIQPRENSVEIRFEDCGPGIPPDKVARIFEPFYTEKERGVGMGLAVCSRIATVHDGTIQAATRPGGGAAFVVRLPRALPGAPEGDETGRTAASGPEETQG